MTKPRKETMMAASSKPWYTRNKLLIMCNEAPKKAKNEKSGKNSLKSYEMSFANRFFRGQYAMRGVKKIAEKLKIGHQKDVNHRFSIDGFAGAKKEDKNIYPNSPINGAKNINETMYLDLFFL